MPSSRKRKKRLRLERSGKEDGEDEDEKKLDGGSILSKGEKRRLKKLKRQQKRKNARTYEKGVDNIKSVIPDVILPSSSRDAPRVEEETAEDQGPNPSPETVREPGRLGLRVIETTGPQRKDDIVKYLKGLRSREKSLRTKTKVVVFINKIHQSRILQEMLAVQSSKPELTQRGQKKARTWTLKGVHRIHRKHTDEEKTDIIKDLKSGKVHTLLLPDEDVERVTALSHTIGVVVHHDFPLDLKEYQQRLGCCEGSVPRSLLCEESKDGGPSEDSSGTKEGVEKERMGRDSVLPLNRSATEKQKKLLERLKKYHSGL